MKLTISLRLRRLAAVTLVSMNLLGSMILLAPNAAAHSTGSEPMHSHEQMTHGKSGCQSRCSPGLMQMFMSRDEKQQEKEPKESPLQFDFDDPFKFSFEHRINGHVGGYCQFRPPDVHAMTCYYRY